MQNLNLSLYSHKFSRALSLFEIIFSEFRRCLSPGMYAHHLDRWLLYFPPQQISVIDGEQVRLDPVTSMTKLQHFLKIRPIFDYSLHLRYEDFKKRKAFMILTRE